MSHLIKVIFILVNINWMLKRRRQYNIKQEKSTIVSMKEKVILQSTFILVKF